jgi:hypothetical protein
MIMVKVYKASPIDIDSGIEDLLSAALPKLVETYSFKEEDRAAVDELFSVYDPDEFMIVVKYREPSFLGQKWLEFSTMYGGLSGNTGNVLDYIIGKA